MFSNLDGNLTKLYTTFDTKLRKINSTKKIFESIRSFEGCKDTKYFKIYADKDIGFIKRWQKPLKHSVKFYLI